HYFSGPAIDIAAAIEHRAPPGEVLFDAALRQRVPGAEAEPITAERFKSIHPGKPIRRLPVAVVPLPVEGAYFLPPGVAEMPKQGEFRDVVSVFVAFGDVGDVSGLIRLLNELATVYGGTFTGLDFGDKGTNALIHFGAPVSHENDTERALDFALELQRMTGRMARIRAGVTRDVRYVGWNGGTKRREFACLGRATNLAARLMMKAGWGAGFCDRKVFADAAARYEFEARGDFVLKGFEHPVEVHALVSKRPAFEQPREYSAKELVGREAELTRLLRSVDPVFSGSFAG